MNKYLGLIIASLFLTVAALIAVVSKDAREVQGSTFVGNDYMATSTRNVPGSSLTNLAVLKSGYGALARVTVTGANTGVIRLYNATTSDVNLRTGGKSTSTVFIAEIPASAAAGVYDFDVEFSDGLLYELVSGNAPTSTIVWR